MPCHATQCNACMSKCVYMCVLAAAKYVLNGPERSRRPACFVVMWFCEMADGRLGYKLFLTSMLLCTCGFPDEHIVGRRWEMLSCKERCLQMFAVIWNMCFHAPPCFGPNAVGTDYCTMQMWYDGLTTNYRLAKCALYALCTFVVCCPQSIPIPSSRPNQPSIPPPNYQFPPRWDRHAQHLCKDDQQRVGGCRRTEQYLAAVGPPQRRCPIWEHSGNPRAILTSSCH